MSLLRQKIESLGVIRFLLLAGLLLTACSGVSATPVSIVVRPLATATPLPSATPLSATDLAATLTASMPTLQPTPTLSGLRTKTPVPGSPSPEPTATRRRGGGAAPASTATPTSDPSLPGGGALDTRAQGVTGNLQMEATDRVYQAGEHMWFRWTVTNLGTAPLSYGYIGVLLSTGEFHTSWSTSSLDGKKSANWRDWVSFSAPGDYTLVLAICVSPASQCSSTGQWINLTAPLGVRVVP